MEDRKGLHIVRTLNTTADVPVSVDNFLSCVLTLCVLNCRENDANEAWLRVSVCSFRLQLRDQSPSARAATLTPLQTHRPTPEQTDRDI